MKRVALTLDKGFICERQVEAIKRIAEPAEDLICYDHVELVKNFCTWKTEQMSVVGVKRQ